MRQIPILTLLLGLVLLTSSCDTKRKDPVGSPMPLTSTSPLTIQVGQTWQVEPFGLGIRFDTVLMDDRCPFDADCGRRGMAISQLTVATTEADRQTVIFHTDPLEPALDRSRYIVTEAGKFEIEMISLDPYPYLDSTLEPGDYSVTIEVSTYQAAEGVIGKVVPTRLPAFPLHGNRIDIDSMRVSGTELTISVHYGGGCKHHNFTLFMAPPMFAESNPVQADLYLFHNANDDFCRALAHENLTFDLQPLLDVYGREDEPIILNIHDLPDSAWERSGSIRYEPPEVEASPILPLAIGNYWIYADTVWQNGVPESSLDTIEVIDFVSDPLGEWWILSEPLLTLGDRIMLKGDSIYSLQRRFLSDLIAKEYIPAVDTPVIYDRIIDTFGPWSPDNQRTVYMSDTSIIVPAGTFSDLWAYTTRVHDPDPWLQYFKPEVGFISTYYQYTFFSLNGSIEVIHHTRLVEYHVVE